LYNQRDAFARQAKHKGVRETMKNITLALAALAAAGSGPAYAQSFANPFVELSLGNVEELNSPSGNRATTGGGAGDTFGLSGGFANVVGGLDVRVDYLKSGLDFLALADDLEAHALFVNFLLTFPIAGETFKFYVGPGIGALKGRFDGPCNFCGPGVTTGEDTNIAWQGVAGVRAQLSGPLGVFLEGRYVSSEELEITPTFKPEYEAAVVLAGARLQF
jgi:opacity protein-like surface antigen